MKNAKAVLAVKFKSTLGPDELSKATKENLQGYREVPGLVEKYFLSEEGSGLISGFYVFSTVSAREAFWESELAKASVPRYGVVVDTARVERYVIDLVLTEVV
ncbi:MAG: hypothetical protein ACXVLT_01975 [Flavisolibacter sp.]